MYAIANIVYGVPVEGDLEDKPALNERFELDYSDSGFIKHYSGNAEFEPKAFGIQLDSFDECEIVDLSKIVLSVTEETREQYNRMYQALKEDEKDELNKCGLPHLFILWSTS